MPKAFLDCVKKGGKVRTVNIDGTRKYFRICILGGKQYRGEIRTRKGGARAK